MTMIRLNPKKLIIVISVVSLVLGATYHFGPKVFLLYIINKNVSRSDTPNIYLTPKLRDIRPINLNHLKSGEIELNFISLKFPWKIKQKNIGETSNTFLFHEKKAVIISSIPKEDKIADEFLKGTPDEVKGLKKLIGEEHLHSDFDFIRLCLNTTPDDATLFTPKRLLGRITTMLMLRAIYEPLGGNIFEFNLNNGLRGFQFGEIGNKKMVTIHLFDDERQIFQVDFMSATQNEIDFVLSSIKVL